MQAQAPFTPELARGNARTDTAPLPAAQSVGFAGIQVVPREFSRPAFMQGGFYFEKYLRKGIEP